MNIFVILLSPLILIAAAAPVGATVCGAVAISRIRRSGGKLYGLGLALADTLLFPLLAMDALIGVVWLLLLQAVANWTGGDVQLNRATWLLLSVVTAIIADVLAIRWAWLAVSKPIGQTPNAVSQTPVLSPEVAATQIERARQAVKAPAIGMIVAAGINLAVMFAAILMLILFEQRITRDAYTAQNITALLAVALPLNALILGGALWMFQLRYRGFAIAGAILALIAAPGNIIGLPMGIWALVVLSRREVIEAFKLSEKDKTMGKSRAFMWVLLAVVAILTPVALWAASRPGQATSQPSSQFPSAAHYGNDKGSVYVVHAGDEVHYAFFYTGRFTSSTSGSQNAHSLTWIDKGSVKLADGKTFGFLRESVDPVHLSVNGKEYDLRQGRVLALHADGSVQQLKLFPTLAVARDVGAMATAIGSAKPADDAPRALKTTPAAFAADVDPSLDKITVTFDRPMMDKSWSFTAGDKAFSEKTGSQFPERAGEISYDTARTTCTMPVRLQPGKVYWVGVNSPQHQQFKSADGTPARPYQILFATRSAGGKPTPLPEELVKQAEKINAADQMAGLTLLLSRDDKSGGGAPGPHFRLTVRNGSDQVLKLNVGDTQFHCVDAAGRSYSTPLPTTRDAAAEEGVAPGAERLLRTTGCGGDGHHYSGWGPKDGGFTIWATGPQGLESNRIRVDLATTRPATQPAATFGPVIERVLPDSDTPGADTLFDLDKQRALRPYQGWETDQGEKYQAWLVENGVDVAARVHPTAGGLRCKDVAWTKVPQGQWDQMTAAEAAKMAGTLVPMGWSTMKPGPVDADADWASSTFVFRTREGGVGLLQIVKFNQDPKTVSIRYKLVDSSAPLRQTAQAFLTALRNKDMDAMKALSLGSVRGWVSDEQSRQPGIGQLPGMSVRRLEKAIRETHEEVYKDDLDLMTKIEEAAIDGDWAGVKVGHPRVQQKYIIFLFTRTSAGWRFVMVDDARKPLAEELAARAPRLQEFLASPSSQPATQPSH